MRHFSSPLTLVLGLGMAISTQATVTGQWDFTAGLSATVGTDLAYRGDTVATFTTRTIGSQTADVMQIPKTSPLQGFVMTHGVAPNGGGSYVNQYSLIMDLMYPAESTGLYRSLLQTATDNDNDGDLFVGNAGKNNGIGTIGVYGGTLAADTWYRVAFVFDLTTSSLSKYIDGASVGTQTLSEGADARWSLGATALLFADEDDETEIGYVNSIQIHDVALSESYIASLGGATAAGIPVVPEPTSGLLFGTGLFMLAMRRTRRNG